MTNSIEGKMTRRSFLRIAALSTLVATGGAISLAGCTHDEGAEAEPAPREDQTQQPAASEMSALSPGSAVVAYFSMPETSDAANMSSEEELSTVVVDGEVLGNTQFVASIIRETVGADLFRIETQAAYPLDHAELEAFATEEKVQAARPTLAASLEGLERYDTVFLGYPIWYGDMPMAVYSFLEGHDLSGKTIVPFCTCGATGLSATPRSIAELQQGAEVSAGGYSVTRDVVQDAEPEIVAWLDGLGYAR